MLKLGVHKTFKGEKLYKEVWKDIEGYEGYYKVSNLGKVKSVDRIIKYKDDRVYYTKGKILIQDINTRGYKYVTLSKESMRRKRTVHRLVIEAFIPNPENKPCIDHINTIKTDNRVQNLRWVTQKENLNNELTLERKRERYKKGHSEEAKEKMRKSSPNKKKVLCVETGIIYESASEASRQTGIWSVNIRRVCKGKVKSAGGYHWEPIESN